MIFLYILVFLNLAWLGLITYLTYQKNRQINQTDIPISQSGVKINVTRYNPFEDIGGDQSFILVLLDKDNSGLLLTSLHHRSFSRIYAKPIKNGQGDNITLSKEEKSAILKTISR